MALPAAAQTPDTLASRPVRVVERVAPLLADTSTVSGRVGLTAIVDAAGQLLRLRITAPLRADADSAALVAVRQWRFAPATDLLGRPVAGALRVGLTFQPGPLPFNRARLPEWAQRFDPLPRLVFLSAPGPGTPSPPSVSTASACGDVRAPEKRSGAFPHYPDELRRAGRNGRVVMGLWLDDTGRPQATTVQAVDEEGFVENTRRAVSTWRFSPATCDGVAVSSLLLVPVRFLTHVSTGDPFLGGFD